MQRLLYAVAVIILRVALTSSELDNSSYIIEEYDILENAGFPNLGDIPILNRKIFRGRRATIREHPYVVSIRRNYVHYLTGVLLTQNLVLTVAHALLDIPVYELGVVVGENYSDRGSIINTVILVILHKDFDRFTLQYDIGLLRMFENVIYRGSVKPIALISSSYQMNGANAFVTGWGRCDNMGSELCLPRASRYFPGEKMDPMLRSVSFVLSIPNYYCEGYIRNNIKFYEGMICLGPAREESPVCPCLAVPGAPLVVNARLVGISSWGFGCGYVYDLPLVYTDVTFHTPWIQQNIVLQHKIKQENLTSLFRGTKAYEFLQFINETRLIKPNLTFKSYKYIEPLDVDSKLALIPGIVYDIRDYINSGVYRIFKTTIYDSYRFANKQLQKLKHIKDSNKMNISPHPFIRKELLTSEN